MRFLLDHDGPAEVARVLRHWGHDASLIGESLPVTTSDRDILQYAQQHVRIIVSCNRDHFLALAQQALREEHAFAGLIVLIRRRTRQAECAHLLSLLRRAGESGLSGNINFA